MATVIAAARQSRYVCLEWHGNADFLYVESVIGPVWGAVSHTCNV